MWWAALGPDEARALMRRDNEPAESAVRANTLRTTRDALAAARSAWPRAPSPDLPEALVLERAVRPARLGQFERGELMPQSRASMLVARVLDPQPGERVLDLCAAPGRQDHPLGGADGEPRRGRRGGGERSPRRGARGERAAAGRGHRARGRGDARRPVAGGPFDRVLLDPPCSDLGTLQARPDVRWRKDAATVERLAASRRPARGGRRPGPPGGTLVYSTCTISPRENEERMGVFLDSHTDFTADDLSAAWPDYAHAPTRASSSSCPIATAPTASSSRGSGASG